jgi:hypothetical protein
MSFEVPKMVAHLSVKDLDDMAASAKAHEKAKFAEQNGYPHYCPRCGLDLFSKDPIPQLSEKEKKTLLCKPSDRGLAELFVLFAKDFEKKQKKKVKK